MDTTYRLKVHIYEQQQTDVNVTVTEPITILTPSDGTHFNACSLYSLPAFSWNAWETFKSYKIQFSPYEEFNSVPIEIKSPRTETIINANKWKKLLMIPGTMGGTVYWRVVGMRSDKRTATSGIHSIIIEPPIPVGDTNISSTIKSSLPKLSWQNNCNTKFIVWFSNDSDFTKPGIKKKALSFNIKNPNDNGRTFTKMLTLGQWTAIRQVVGNASGSPIYWYVESWNGLKRYTKTEVQSFTLTD